MKVTRILFFFSITSLLGCLTIEEKNQRLLSEVRSGDLNRVKDMLSQGADVNAAGIRGRWGNQSNWFEGEVGLTPLNLAAYRGHFEIAKLLIAKGAKVNARNKRGWTPLHSAAHHNSIGIAKLLIAKGAKVNTRSIYGWTPLHSALEKNSIEIAKLLIAKGAKVNTRNKRGWTPLHSAAENCNFGMVKLLLRRRANPKAETEKGYTPSDLAHRALGDKEGCGPVVRLLRPGY